MTSFSYRLNPRFAIKECSSCGTLYTRDCSYSKGSVEDKILVSKPHKNCARCAKCGHPVNGPYCQGCSLLREKHEEDLVTYFQNFQNIFESSDDSTNVVNAPREPFVVKQDHDVNPPHIDECCCECGNALDGIFCQQCTCKSCGKGAHIGYNCPPKVSIISNPEPCNQTINNELPQTLPSFDSMCYFDKENSVPCVSKHNFVDESSNIFNPPPQPPIYSCEFCGSNAQYGHYYTPQALFNNPEPDEVTKSSVEDLVPIPSEFEENIEYVEASPHDSEVVSLEVAEIVIPKVEEIEDDNLREKLLNVHLLIANIEALKDNPTPTSKLLTKSLASPKSFLEETNTFHNSLPEFENFYFDLEEISSGKISSGSTTTHSDISLSEYDSITFDPSNDQFPPTNRSDFTHEESDFTHEEFADELAHIISPPEYDCFYFRNLLDPGELMSILNSGIRENLSTTCVNLPIEDDHSPLLTYVVWIFLAYLTYPVTPPYLHSFGNEDTIFDPGITINRFCLFKPGLSHRRRAFKKFNTHRSHLNEWPIIINGKNIPILDVLLFHFYPP
uniref:Uncharacterized protein n=1 Tax=Tanacetum cinerariifolium TaxID=118510 RepID=A0A6L2NSF2_TANCI|nr:hypothetical protein [Tanacetum cinerariifolium]